MLRPPIITVLGHVDHGKTSLLDALRGTDVASGESGGITQHTGASQVDYKGNKITFIDTPGHEAFSEMRSRGGKIADIAILVVAANDGVKPQTKEAIYHIKQAKIPYIVAINKIDIDGVSIDKVKSQLSKEGVELEEYGGDVMCVEVSATKGTNLDKLLEAIVLLSDMVESKDSSKDKLRGYVIESRHDSKKGTVANVVVTNGVLTTGTEVVVGNNDKFRIRSLSNYKGERVKSISAGESAEILGIKEVADPGDLVVLASDVEADSSAASVTTDETKNAEEDKKEGLNIVLRADTQGTLEALKASLGKLEYEGKGVNIVLAGVGEPKESDVLLASTSKSLLIVFNTKIPSVVKDRSEVLGVITRSYTIIYELLDELKGALEGVFEIEEEKVKGRAEVLKVFPLPSGDVVAGCYVTHGRLRVGDSVVVKEGDEELFKSKIKKLKKSSTSTDLVGKDTECGLLLLNNHENIQQGLTVEVL